MKKQTFIIKQNGKLKKWHYAKQMAPIWYSNTKTNIKTAARLTYAAYDHVFSA